MGYEIAEVAVGPGLIGVAPMPGLAGDYRGDLAALVAWTPTRVLTLAGQAEAEACGAGRLGTDLGRRGIDWGRFAIRDFGTPDAMARELWPAQAAGLGALLARGGRLLIHCRGGCGRSGMIALRLMVEAGEPPEAALDRLRAARPCAVETAAQMAWAVGD